MLRKDVVEKYFKLRLVDIDQLSGLRELLAERPEGTYLLRRVLDEHTNPDTLNQIMAYVGEAITGGDTSRKCAVPKFKFENMRESFIDLVILTRANDNNEYVIVGVLTLAAVKKVCDKFPYLFPYKAFNSESEEVEKKE